MMNKYLIFLLFIGITACQSPTGKQSTTDKLPEKVEEEEIIFDENLGEASLERNFYFLFDGSGSMDEYCAGERKIDGAKKAINKFLDKLPEDINLGLLIFGVSSNEYGISEVVPLGPGNREQFKQAISEIYPDGGTPLANATYSGINSLVKQYKKQLGYGEYRLIIVTDGLASYPDEFKKTLIDSRKYPFIAIYGIGLCIEGNHILKTYSLSYTDAHNYDDLGKALEETVSELPYFDPAEFNVDDLVLEK